MALARKNTPHLSYEPGTALLLAKADEPSVEDMAHSDLTQKKKNYKEIIDGYFEDFLHKYFDDSKGKKPYGYYVQSEGQKPLALVIACSDSRVDPAILTEAEAGDLFVVRNIANLVSPYHTDGNESTKAALEYGIEHLGIQNIIVLGHTHCGGIKALFSDDNQSMHPTFVDAWMKPAKPVKDLVLKRYPHATTEEQISHGEKESLIKSFENLKTYPWIEKGINEGKISIQAWCFDLETGVLERYDPEKNKFIKLENPEFIQD